MMAEELVSIQKNEYKELLLQSVALFLWLVREPLMWLRSAFEEGLKVIACTTEPQLVTKDIFIKV